MIKAIETLYEGYRFRSRLEARWAVFFDALGIKYLYELEGFNLDDIWYLPDFYLPQVKMWAEVKPTDLTKDEYWKCKKLVEQTDEECLLLIGIPENKPYIGITPPSWGYEDEEALYCLTMYHNYPIDEERFYCNPGDFSPDGDAYHEDTDFAADMARQARFETASTYLSVGRQYKFSPEFLSTIPQELR